MRAVAVDHDRAGADLGELGALGDVAAQRDGAGRIATDADDRGGALAQREDAEQVWEGTAQRT